MGGLTDWLMDWLMTNLSIEWFIYWKIYRKWESANLLVGKLETTHKEKITTLVSTVSVLKVDAHLV